MKSKVKTDNDLINSLDVKIRELETDSSVLLDITLDVLEASEKRKTLQKIVEGAVHLIGLDTGTIYLLKENNLILEVATPSLPEDYPEEHRIARLQNHPHIKQAIDEKSPLMISDITSQVLSVEEEIVVKSRNLSSLLYIPLYSMQKVSGVMILGTIGRKYEFNKREVDLCYTLSNISSLALENSALFEQLKMNIDELKSTIRNKEITEARLRLLNRAVEQSPVCIIVTDHTGSIEYVNPKFTDVTGYTGSEAIGKNPRIVKSGYHPQEFYEELWKTLTSGKDWYGEMKNRKKNGELYWENVLISPMKDEKGNITHFVGVKEDITEKKSMIENLITAKNKAEESDRLKTAFLHNISHEIRTPLNAIVGFSTFLNDPDLLPEKKKMYTDIIVSSNDQLLYIIDGIMKLSHLEAGQAIAKKAETNIMRVTGTLYNQFRPVAEGRNLQFTLDNGNIDQNDVIVTDEGKLKQIISNLLDNAFKFTQNGYVEFGCRKYEDIIEFRVADSGIGIREVEHDKIFERFYQVDKSGSQIYGGTGLGLSICKGYASLLGGSLEIKSTFGTGSVFTLKLPLKSN